MRLQGKRAIITGAASGMGRSGRGLIVLISSFAGLVGYIQNPVYSATKFALVDLAKSLALRFALETIRNNAVCPGPIDSEGDHATHGFLVRDRKVENLRERRRITERDATTGLVSRLIVESVDVTGRSFRAICIPLSRIVINCHTFIDNNSLIEWTMDTREPAWGEDQDCCPTHRWADQISTIKAADHRVSV